jgi:hypothetical protein
VIVANLGLFSEVEEQIENYRRKFDYETFEMTTEILHKKLKEGELYIPEYQRPHIWDVQNQSNFIESLLLGLPTPYLFCCEMADGKLEVVDGSQRLRTIESYFDDKLVLKNLEKLDSLHGLSFSDLPLSQQRKLKNRPVRMITLRGRASQDARFDIFHRLNSGGMRLTDAQIRKGAFAGPFYDLVVECAADLRFQRMCPSTSRKDPSGEREELVLRFFAYYDRYTMFRHDVAEFLNAYIKEMNLNANLNTHGMRTMFERMVSFVEQYFPNGFTKGSTSKQVPRVRFEAISVGSALALDARNNLTPRDMAWLESDDFARLTRTEASNSGPRLTSRIEFVRDQLLRV